jgi:hypothetical protein
MAPPPPDVLAARRARILAEDDATVERSVFARTPLGPTDFLVVGGSSGRAAWRSYLRFDLGPLGPSPRIVRADLVVVARDDVPDLPRGSMVVGVYRVARPWAAEVTWRSQPGPVGEERSALRVPTGRRIRLRFDVRALVVDWIRGVVPNRGLVLVSRREEDDRRVVFHSSHSPERSARPVLEVWTR